MSEAEISEIIAMAWDDETPFDAIERHFGLSEADTIKLMRQRNEGFQLSHVAQTRFGTHRQARKRNCAKS